MNKSVWAFLPKISPIASDCRGFVFGNATGDAASATLLAKLGYVGPVKPGIDNVEGLFGKTVIGLNIYLFGETIIGVRYGNGGGSLGRDLGTKGAGDEHDTAFYKFDAGTAGINKITLNYGASSSVRLYKTGVRSVPEPATWMFMLLGMAGVGFSMRRNGKQDLRVRYN